MGLPLALEFAKKYPTVGYDISSKRINELKEGIDTTLEVSTEESIDAIVFAVAHTEFVLLDLKPLLKKKLVVYDVKGVLGTKANAKL